MVVVMVVHGGGTWWWWHWCTVRGDEDDHDAYDQSSQYCSFRIRQRNIPVYKREKTAAKNENNNKLL